MMFECRLAIYRKSKAAAYIIDVWIMRRLVRGLPQSHLLHRVQFRIIYQFFYVLNRPLDFSQSDARFYALYRCQNRSWLLEVVYRILSLA